MTMKSLFYVMFVVFFFLDYLYDRYCTIDRCFMYLKEKIYYEIHVHCYRKTSKVRLTTARAELSMEKV